MKTFGNFVKTAEDKLGKSVYSVPLDKAEDAYALYCKVEGIDKVASIIEPLYDTIQDGTDRIALDMVSANILEKQAGIPMAGMISKGLQAFGNGGKIGDKIVGAINHPIGQALLWGPSLFEGAKYVYDGVSNLFSRKKSHMSEGDRLQPYANTY